VAPLRGLNFRLGDSVVAFADGTSPTATFVVALAASERLVAAEVMSPTISPWVEVPSANATHGIAQRKIQAAERRNFST